MADEVGSAALSSGQKIVEVSAELIKMLAPLLEKLIQNIYHNSVDGLNNVGEKIADFTSKGTVSNKNLFLEAQKANCGISTTSNILARDMETFAEKAKQYNIPVAVVGKGQTQSIEFLDRDKGIVEQITQEIVQERLHEAPQSVKCFSISENNVTAMKAAFEEHGIECQFMKAPKERIQAVAEKLGMTVNEVKDYLSLSKKCLQYTSLNTVVDEENQTELEEMLPDENAPSVEERIEENELHKRLHTAISELEQQERDIIIRRYGMNGSRIYTLEELGEIHGLSVEWVRQIEERALRKLKYLLK